MIRSKILEIKFGCTQTNSLASWQPQLTTVFSPKSISNTGPIGWTPSVGANAPTPTNIVNPIANPETPVVYEVDVTASNGCHSQDFVYVYVDTSLRFYAFPAGYFFLHTVR